jgi:thiosulfate/3-mercaptopyruvate sulfurtransferase
LSGGETAVYEDALNSGYGQSCRGYYLLTWLPPQDQGPERRLFSLKAQQCLAVSTEAATPVAKTFPTDLALADVMLTKMTSSPR